MGLIGANSFFEAFGGIRDCFITGRKGGGKTLLAFALAQYAIQQKFCRGVVANIEHTFPKSLDEEGRPDVRDAFVIVDEAWQLIDNRYSISNFNMYGAWSRKTNSLWAFPSVYGIDKRVRNLEVERMIDLMILPVRVWVYRWRSVYGEGGMFYLTNPQDFFGTFDSYGYPVDDGGALDSVMRLLPEGIELVQRGRGRGKIFVGDASGREASVGQSKFRELEERLDALEGELDAVKAIASSAAAGVVGLGAGEASGLRFGQ